MLMTRAVSGTINWQIALPHDGYWQLRRPYDIESGITQNLYWVGYGLNNRSGKVFCLRQSAQTASEAHSFCNLIRQISDLIHYTHRGTVRCSKDSISRGAPQELPEYPTRRSDSTPWGRFRLPLYCCWYSGWHVWGRSETQKIVKVRVTWDRWWLALPDVMKDATEIGYSDVGS